MSVNRFAEIGIMLFMRTETPYLYTLISKSRHRVKKRLIMPVATFLARPPEYKALEAMPVA
jgi:hypothetical protein